MLIKSPNKLISRKKSTTYVFLGGPIQGSSNWQDSLPDISGVTWISPRRDDISGSLNNDDWEKQVEWETLAIRISDVILFWIPSPIEELPGRDYAQTTRMELLENLARGKKIILGIDNDIHAKRYMSYKSIKYGVTKINNTLNDCLLELKEYLSNRKDSIFFTSDTHFGSDRALKLSRRPFRDVEDMNITMIERWNNKVSPNSIVYHLGDFGDKSFLNYLNGNVTLILGNYERDESKEVGLVDYLLNLKSLGFNRVIKEDSVYVPDYGELSLVHEPRNSIGSENKYYLFGHIHEKQKIKHNGINVSVDCNNFAPMSIEDVKFYLNAFEKNYYDEEVFF